VLGWFAFVLAAFAVGSAAGVVYLRADELGIGDSHGAEQVLAREFPTERGVEEVLIRSRGRRLGAPRCARRPMSSLPACRGRRRWRRSSRRSSRATARSSRATAAPAVG
jgi:hypothetical protein